VSALPPAAILTDIEGTTTPASFMHAVLSPYAIARLARWLDRPDSAPERAEIRSLAPGQPELQALRHWLDTGAKVTPLQTLLARIWHQGYQDGTLKGALYPDVAPCLRRWVHAGLRLYTFSSGATAAQKQLFAWSQDGDLSHLFTGFFDTRVGPKREPDSYGRLAIAMNVPPVEVLFLSDVEEELDAASVAGMRTCQLVRPDEDTIASDRHEVAPDFPGVADRIGLPRAA
jgi:enolase-phosphatase E1